jgi:creatinine amidohydrolase
MKTWIPDSRNFAYLTWPEVDKLPRDRTLLILPTAAIEQHGHHLPLATDTLINNFVLGHALQRLPETLPVYALPPICYGKSNEHIGYPGTLALSARTFMDTIHDLGASIASAGFQKLVLYNTHGGNISCVDVMARDLRAEFGLRTFYLSGSGGAKFDDLDPQEKTYGFHAGELETSLLLAACPELVHPDCYSVNYIARADDPQTLTPEGGPANFAWLTRDIAPSGVMGDPRPSSAEKGARWLERMAAAVAKALVAMVEFNGVGFGPGGTK